MADSCRICGSLDEHASYQVREMMYGTREEFRYFQCSKCGCLQIASIPVDLGCYYPTDYYSYGLREQLAASSWRRWRYSASGWLAGSLNRLFGQLFKPPKHFAWVSNAGITTSSRILDVGCGSGKYLLKMYLGGYTNGVGIDPFIEETIRYSNGLTIHKQTLEAFSESAENRFDLIMFHHSLEHMKNPLSVIRLAVRMLVPEGKLLIRIPLADSYAWEFYREDWVQLDAPRHLYLLTRKSMEILASQAGLKIQRIDYDSVKLQLICSELYRRDIAGNAPKHEQDVFSVSELRAFKRKVKELNDARRGDQAVFLLEKKQILGL